jgi:hypothetical protein
MTLLTYVKYAYFGSKQALNHFAVPDWLFSVYLLKKNLTFGASLTIRNFGILITFVEENIRQDKHISRR